MWKQVKIAAALAALLLVVMTMSAGRVFGQSTQTVILPDCSVSYTLTGAGSSTTIDNRVQGCANLAAEYFSQGFSGITVTVESAQDNGGTPGSWSTFAGTVVTGSNPSTSTTSTVATFTGYYPWLRVTVSGITGTGTVRGRLYGYRYWASRTNPSGPPSGAAGGDLTGTYPNPTLVLLGVTPGTYGSATQVAQVTVDAKGRTTAATNVTITGTAPGGSAGGCLSGTYPNPGIAGITVAGGIVFGNGTPCATQDPTRFFYDVATGFMNIGGNAPLTELEVDSSSSADPRGVTSAQYSTNALGSRFQFMKARGTKAVPTVVVTADVLGRLTAAGYDGSAFLQSARIEMGTEGTIGANRVPTFISFLTNTDASPSVLTERMRIDSVGTVIIPGVGSYRANAPATRYVQFTNVANSVEYGRIGSESTGSPYLASSTGLDLSLFEQSTARLRIKGTTGNVQVGSTGTDRNYRFLVNSSGSVGTESLVDTTATTGFTLVDIGWDGTNTSALTTQMRIRNGVAQGGTSALLLTNNAGTSLAGFTGTTAGVFSLYNGGSIQGQFVANGGLLMGSGRLIGWDSTANVSGSIDTSLYRGGPGLIDMSNGSDCSTASNCRDYRARSYVASGASPAFSSGTIVTGSRNAAGAVTSNTTGAFSTVITFAGTTAPVGWSCTAFNSTTTANPIGQTASSTTTATIAGTTVSGDVIRYVCIAY